MTTVPLPPPADLPVLSKLSSITLHWRNERNGCLDLYPAEVFENTSSLTADCLQWAPNLQTIGLQLHFDKSASSRRKRGRMPTVALGLTRKTTREQCLDLEQALADLRLKQYFVSLNLPSQWTRSEATLRRCLEQNFSGLHAKGLLMIEIHGGKLNV